MDIPVCFTLVHKGWGSWLLSAVPYYKVFDIDVPEVQGGVYFTGLRVTPLPGLALPYQVAPVPVASSWAGRHSLSHGDSTPKCCQGMLNPFAG